ncbi:glutaredoxin family protein [Aquipuribacter sp. MA13-6]|uniref:glutaredoxin family protein n=1 Tax=unclassified Aquipuribacter TaxID=2635084 RepID=UPI003EEC0C48
MSARAARPPVQVRLIGKPGCHLCDEARVVVQAECRRAGAELTEVSVLDDPELHARFWDRIPVVEVDGATVEQLRVDPVRLRRLLSPGRRRRLLW